MKTKKLSFLLFFACIYIFSPFAGKAQICLDFSENGRHFRCWIPEEVDILQGIYIFFPGLNHDARVPCDETNHLFYKIAHRYRFAVVSMREFYTYSEGDYQVLKNALSKFAIWSNHPELTNLPLAVWGGSLGAASTYNMNIIRKHMMIAGFAKRTHLGTSLFINAESAQTPMIFNPGYHDTNRKKNSLDAFKSWREITNAKFALWVSWNSYHTGDAGDGTSSFGHNFLTDMIEMRHPWNVDFRSNTATLHQLTHESGYVTDHKTWNAVTKVYEYNHTPPNTDIGQSSWLATKDLAYSYIPSSTNWNPDYTNAYRQNIVKIADDTTLTNTDKPYRAGSIPFGSNYNIYVWSDSIPDIDSIYLYNDSEIVLATQTDSLHFTASNLEGGFHCFWAKLIDNNKNEYVTLPLFVWVDCISKFNPINQPMFDFPGNLTVNENFDSTITLQIKPYFNDRPVGYSFEPKTSEIAVIQFDSINGILTIDSLYNHSGIENFIVKSHYLDSVENVYNTFSQRFKLNIVPELPYFHLVEDTFVYKNNPNAVKLQITPNNENIPATYHLVSDNSNIIDIEIDSISGLVTFTALPDAVGEKVLRIKAINTNDRKDTYTKEITIGVYQDIRFKTIEDFTYYKNFGKDTFFVETNSDYNDVILYAFPLGKIVRKYIKKDPLRVIFKSITDVYGTEEYTLRVTDSQYTSNRYEQKFSITVLNEESSIVTTDKEHHFAIYPVPVKNKFHVDIKNEIKVQQVEIYDIRGKKIPYQSIYGLKSNRIYIELYTNMPAGIYLIKFQDKEKAYYCKIVKN